ncbi:MAG: hypothetical protein K6C95_06585 [Lachnospiraceae bacterium]|nr:hypothetical protein [Lachnospiraceae bacterium]
MEKKPQKPVRGFVITAATCVGTGVAAFAYGRDVSEIIRAMISAFAGAYALSVMLTVFSEKDLLIEDNALHPKRFFIGYLLSLAVALLLPLIVADAWPFMAIYVVLALVSSPFVGAYAGTLLLMLTVLLQGGSTPEFFMYIFAGFIAVALLGHLDENMKTGLPVFIALIVQTMFIVCYHVMFLRESLSVKIIVVPFINAFIDFAILIVGLNAFSFYVVRKTAERYMEVNDPSFALMTRFRDTDEKLYKRAIHTDYLTQRVAAALDMDARKVRSMSYYHRIFVVLEEKSTANCEDLLRQYSFPEDAISGIMELVTHKKGEPLSAEATVVQLCETMIASLQFMFEKDREVNVDYSVLVDRIFAKQRADGEFAKSRLSLFGLGETERLLKKETLYYDFLR